MVENPASINKSFKSPAVYTTIPFIRSVHIFPSSGLLTSKPTRKHPPFRKTRTTSANAISMGDQNRLFQKQ